MNLMAYERRKDTSKTDTKFDYVIVNENDNDCESDSSDTFFNGPRNAKSVSNRNQRVQVILCLIVALAVVLLIFIIYNFLTFIFAVQSAMHKFEEQIPIICQTARMLNSKVAQELKFCANVTVTPIPTISGFV